MDPNLVKCKFLLRLLLWKIDYLSIQNILQTEIDSKPICTLRIGSTLNLNCLFFIILLILLNLTNFRQVIDCACFMLLLPHHCRALHTLLDRNWETSSENLWNLWRKWWVSSLCGWYGFCKFVKSLEFSSLIPRVIDCLFQVAIWKDYICIGLAHYLC